MANDLPMEIPKDLFFQVTSSIKFFQADTAELGKCITGGYGQIGVDIGLMNRKWLWMTRT